MSGTDLTAALAKLLSDRNLRQQFQQDRNAAAKMLDVHEADLAGFLALDEAALEAQAVGLLDKRFHEVQGMAPHTVRLLGGRALEIFREYASGYWPTGHRRHLLDAFHFCTCIREARPDKVCQAELDWLSFLVSQRSFQWRLATDVMVDGKPRWGLQVFRRNREGIPRRMVWRFR